MITIKYIWPGAFAAGVPRKSPNSTPLRSLAEWVSENGCTNHGVPFLATRWCTTRSPTKGKKTCYTAKIQKVVSIRMGSWFLCHLVFEWITGSCAKPGHNHEYLDNGFGISRVSECRDSYPGPNIKHHGRHGHQNSNLVPPLWMVAKSSTLDGSTL